jgi:hypothetical protein
MFAIRALGLGTAVVLALLTLDVTLDRSYAGPIDCKVTPAAPACARQKATGAASSIRNSGGQNRNGGSRKLRQHRHRDHAKRQRPGPGSGHRKRRNVRRRLDAGGQHLHLSGRHTRCRRLAVAMRAGLRHRPAAFAGRHLLRGGGAPLHRRHGPRQGRMRLPARNVPRPRRPAVHQAVPSRSGRGAGRQRPVRRRRRKRKPDQGRHLPGRIDDGEQRLHLPGRHACFGRLAAAMRWRRRQARHQSGAPASSRYAELPIGHHMPRRLDAGGQYLHVSDRHARFGRRGAAPVRAELRRGPDAFAGRQVVRRGRAQLHGRLGARQRRLRLPSRHHPRRRRPAMPHAVSSRPGPGAGRQRQVRRRRCKWKPDYGHLQGRRDAGEQHLHMSGRYAFRAEW